jgi:hypothetical protein
VHLEIDSTGANGGRTSEIVGRENGERSVSEDSVDGEVTVAVVAGRKQISVGGSDERAINRVVDMASVVDASGDGELVHVKGLGWGERSPIDRRWERLPVRLDGKVCGRRDYGCDYTVTYGAAGNLRLERAPFMRFY